MLRCALAALLLAAAPASAAPVAPRLDDGFRHQISARVGLDARSELRHVATFAASTGGTIQRYGQWHRGVPVEDAVVAVRLDASGRLERVLSSIAPALDVDVTPFLTPEQALETGRSVISLPMPATPAGSASLVIVRGSGGRLAWDVSVTTLPFLAMHVLVDAHDGEVLAIRNLAKYVGSARVFPSASAAKSARKPDGSFDLSGLANVTFPDVVSSRLGSYLESADLKAFNCCPTKLCAEGQSALQLKLKLPIAAGITVNADTAICDERPLAIADGDGEWSYTPAKEPTSDSDVVPGPSEGDGFSEVQGFHYASLAYAFMRSLDPEFKLRTEAQPLRVTTNFLLPNFREAINNFDFQTYSTSVTTLVRFDNAAFIPAGNGIAGINIPELKRDFDSLVLFQGTKADFAYDADVVTHEFTHGVVQSTAKLADYAGDAQGILPAPGSMNEGFADYFAAARDNDPHIGEYVGDLAGTGEGSLRNLTNDFKCPSIIQGEVHNDSQHFTGALWAARTILGTSAELKKKYDQAIFDALKGLTPDVSFDEAAAVIEAEVEKAFPSSGAAAVGGEFETRGVKDCERVVDLDATKPLGPFGIAPREKARGWGNYAPGPVQFRLKPPAGATGVTLSAKGSAGGGLGIDIPPIPGLPTGNGQPNLQAQIHEATALEFKYGTAGTTSNATETKPFVAGTPSPYTILPLDGACGDKTFFVALENLSEGGAWNLETLTLAYTVDAKKAEACKPVEVPDAGTTVDAGSNAGGGSDTAREGCGCGAGSAGFAAFAGLFLRRRVRRS